MHDHSGAFTAATGRQLEAAGPDKPRYRRYQYELIAPHCGRSVLEVGAGLGEFAEQFDDLDRLVLTDVDPDAVAVMARRFAGRPEVTTQQLELGQSPNLSQPVDLRGRDQRARAHRRRRRCAAVARHGRRGRRSHRSLGPGYQQLYGEFDRKVGHVRRYTPSTLADAVRRAGLDVELVKPVNLLGGIAWWLTVRRSGVSSPNPKMVAAFDRCVVPVTKALERRVRVPFGQSVLCVARKRAEA